MKKTVSLLAFLILAACGSPHPSEVSPTPLQIVHEPSLTAPTPVLPVPIPPSISPPDSAQIELLHEFGKGTISQIAWAPGGSFIAAGGSAGIRFYNAETLREIRFIPTDFLITSVAFSPDGKYLATGSADIVFSRRTYWRRFSPWGSENNHIQLWDVESGELLATLKGGNSYLTTVAFSPDGKMLASASMYSDDNAIRIWELASVIEGDATLWQIHRDHTRGVFGIAFSPDGRRLLSGSGDNSARLWDMFNEENNRILMYRSAAKVKIFAVAYSPVIRDDATELVALAGADFDHNTPTELLELWDANSGELIAELSGHVSSLDSVQFSPDGKLLASGGSYPDNTIHLWNVETGEVLHSLRGHYSGVRSVAFSPDGNTLASSGWDGLLHLWDAETGKLKLTNNEHTSVVHSVAFNSSKNILATGGDEGFIRLWDIQTGEILGNFNTKSSRVTSLEFLENSPYLISGTDEPDFSVQIWNIETWKETHTLLGHYSFSQELALSPDEKLFASGGALGDNTLRVWDLEANGVFLYAIDGHTRSVKSVAFSHDGTLIASGDGKGTLRLINVATGEVQHSIQAHSCAITALFFSEKGNELVSVDCNGNIRFWDKENGSLLQEISTKEAEIVKIGFYDDDLVVAYKDGSLWFYNLEFFETTLKIDQMPGELLSFYQQGDRLIVLVSNNGGKITLLTIKR